MRLRVPSYYKEFRCIADKCKDSCCIGWEIDIDEDTFSYYKSVEGAFGERLRSHMVTEDVNSFALQENGWCPFLNKHKLCDICIELGEEALSEVCTEFPRFTMEYEDVREKVLSLSCEEVGRLVFSSDKKIMWEEHERKEDFCAEFMEGSVDEEYGDEETRSVAEEYGTEEYDEETSVSASELEKVRDEAVGILQNRSKPIFERAAEYLSYCKKMQQELYGNGEVACLNIQADEVIADGENVQGEQEAYADFLVRMERYEQLEVLDTTWEEQKKALFAAFSEENYLESQRTFMAFVTEQKREYEYEHLLVYFTFRYFMRSYYDDNIFAKAQFAVASVLMIRDMDVLLYMKNGGRFSLADRIDTVRIYSKEVEHSEENMELLAEDFCFEEIFSAESLMRQLGK